MSDILTFPFMQNAFIVGSLASICCGIIGTYIVVKNMSFISGSISHAAFGGIGASYFLGSNPLIGAILAGIIAASLISGIRFTFKERDDTLISAVWAIGMAIGLLFIYKSHGYTSDLMSYLFGNILLTTYTDIVIIFSLDIALITIVLILYKYFQAITFDEQFSKVQNIPVKTLYWLLLTLVALSVVILIKLVGIILVIALMTLPAATASPHSKNIKNMMIIASLIGGSSTFTGIIIGYIFDLPSGPTIILITSLLYMGSICLEKFKKYRKGAPS